MMAYSVLVSGSWFRDAGCGMWDAGPGIPTRVFESRNHTVWFRIPGCEFRGSEVRDKPAEYVDVDPKVQPVRCDAPA